MKKWVASVRGYSEINTFYTLYFIIFRDGCWQQSVNLPSNDPYLFASVKIVAERQFCMFNSCQELRLLLWDSLF